MINYVFGDATKPDLQCKVSDDSPAIIVHCVNNKGAWGKGFVTALSSRWPEPERAYRGWHKTFWGDIPLGLTLVTGTSTPNIYVANIVGQDDYKRRYSDTGVFVRYWAIRAGMQVVAEMADTLVGGGNSNATVHMPRIGCGLAGGTWDRIEPALEPLIDYDIDVYVYDFIDG